MCGKQYISNDSKNLPHGYNCNICSFSLSAISGGYLGFALVIVTTNERAVDQIDEGFFQHIVSRCKLGFTLAVYIMRNGYRGICTGSLFLQCKVGPGRFLIGHKVGQNKETH